MENNTHLKRWQNLWRFQYQMGIRVSMQQFHIERISSSSDILGVWLQRCRTQKHGHRNYQLEYRGREKYITNDIKRIGIFEWNLNGNQCHDFEWWSVATCPVFLAKDLLYLFIFHYWYWTLPFSAWNITTHTSWTWFTSSRCPGSWMRVSRLKHRITNTISLIVEIDGQQKFCLLLKFQSHDKRTHFLSHCNF